ncbi:hypothetical protein ACR30L_01215 [Psychromonas sp. PT13]|uniref:hypothetical protein n=1 Tax=Psychromonas sp. PT13 TaxID=3439547 RepID=UPI003EB7AAF4
MQLHQTFTIALLSSVLFACGSSESDSILPGGGQDIDSENAVDAVDTDDVTNTTDYDESIIYLSTKLLSCPSDWAEDVSLCSETTEISAINSGTLAVTLTQGVSPLAREIISAETTIGSLQTDSALTDDNGIAYFTIVSNGDEGAGRITLSTDAEDSETTSYVNFEIGASNVSMTIDNNTDGISLAQNSTALITVNLTADGEAYTVPVEVSFTSACATAETANLDTSVITSNGIAQATYQPTSCVGDDVITASTSVNGLSMSTTINVDSSPADSISFVSATPSNIAIKGTGGSGRLETSQVLFTVVDQNGSPSSLQDVEFELDNAPSGTTIDPITATTNSDGEVYTVVSAGKVAGSVRVKIKLADSDLAISSVSSELSVSTGLPDQDSFSLALEDHSPEALNIDGVTVSANVLLADKFNNAVPDGTAVYFVTEGGAIRDTVTGTLGSCLTSGSGCSLEWISQNPRPDGNKLTDFNLEGECGYFAPDPYGTNTGPCINSGGMGQPYGGRVTITAFAEGEETFVDNDADGWFTEGDDFFDKNDLAEVFFDNNEDDVYKCDDSNDCNGSGDEEEYHDFSPVDGLYSSVNGIYNGLMCSDESEAAGECSTELINVRDSQVLIMASSTQYIRLQHDGIDISSIDITGTDVESYTVNAYFADIYNNRPPTGTTINVSTENGDLSGITSWEVASSSALGPYGIAFTVVQESTPNAKTFGKLSIELETPEGGTLTISLNVYDAG